MISRAFRHLLTISALFVPVMALAAPPATSPYATDTQESYVQDETGEAIGTVNMIMCFMGSMRPDLMVNSGNYAAMIDKNRCESRSSSSSSSAPDYVRAIVNSTRANENEPMSTRVWLENREDDGTEFDIYVSTQVSAGPSDAQPYGEFRLDYGAPPLQGQSASLMQGYLQANANGISFVESGNWGGTPAVTQLALQSLSQSSGSGALRYPLHGAGSRTITFGYNASHFRRYDGTNDRCFSRSLSSAKTSVWRYGLYDEVTGERVDRNGGFPFRATLGGRDIHGYIGYHGLSASPDDLAQLVTGTTITRDSRDGDSDEAYTLVRNAGKLVRHSLRQRALSEADGLRFETWADPTWPGLPLNVSGEQVAMSWDETSQAFVIKASMQCGQNGCNFVDLTSPVSIPAASMATAAPQGVFGHSAQLNGQIYIPAAAMTDSSRAFSYRASRLMVPGDLAAGTTLHCVSDCPTANGLAQLAAGAADDPHDGTAYQFDPVAANAVRSYEINADGVLTQAGSPIIYTGSADALQNSNYQWGVQSGRLVTSLADLECAQSAGQYCANEADELNLYYTWETGPNPWNGYAGARDGQGGFVNFEAPLRVTWQVPGDTGTYGEFAGKSLVLAYNGFGDLYGLPSYCVDPATNSEVACGTQNARWVPTVSIPFDATDGAVTVEGGSTRYLVKWLDREVRFAAVAAGACSAIALGDVARLPDTTSLVNPSDAGSAAYIGAKPSVTTAPHVIDGELQD